MNFLKASIQHLLHRVKSMFYDYKFTAAAAVLFSLLGTADELLNLSQYHKRAFISPNDYDLMYHHFLEVDMGLRFLGFFCIAALFAETCFRGKKLQKRIGLILGAVFAGVSAFVLTWSDPILGVSVFQYHKRAEEMIGGCVLLLLILTFYFSFKHTKFCFEEYVVKIAFNLLIVFCVYFVILIGVMILCVIAETLLFKETYLTEAGLFFVTGTILPLGGILAIDHAEDGDTFHGQDVHFRHYPEKFLQIMIQYVLCIMTICGLVVVYLYMARILVIRELPSNEIFPILTMLFCLGMPVWLMAGCWKKETVYFRCLSVLPYFFAPLIVMQIIAAGMRIGANGMTPDRYAAVMLIIFEIGTIVFWRFKRDKLEKVLLLMSVLVAVTFLVPVVNRYRFSGIWQQTWLQKYYKSVQHGEQLSAREYERLKGAYDYLNDEMADDQMTAIYNIYQEDFIEKLNRQDPREMELTRLERYSVHGCQLVGTLDVGEFGSMDMLNKGDISLGEDKDLEAVDFTRFPFEIRGTGEVILVDISDFAHRSMEYIEENPDASKEEQCAYMQGFHKILLDQDNVLYINHFQVSYCKGIKNGKDYFEWQSIGPVGGMLLQK